MILGDIYKFRKENKKAVQFYDKFLELSKDRIKMEAVKQKREQIAG